MDGLGALGLSNSTQKFLNGGPRVLKNEQFSRIMYVLGPWVLGLLIPCVMHMSMGQEGGGEGLRALRKGFYYNPGLIGP